MDFFRLKTPGIAHNAYLLGTNGIGILIDPRRDIDDYIAQASKANLSIQYVLQTHRHEDFVMGCRALRDATGSRVIAGRHPLTAYADQQLDDGEKLTIGGLTLQALATPGHTPESVSYAVTMNDQPDQVWAVFTGDALFIGETGRTDLPDEAKTGENAGLLYDAIHSRILPLGDHVLLYPAHGAGSACGGEIADYDESTIGFERSYNAVFTLSQQDFIERKLKERLPRPPYFPMMEKLNLDGGKEMPPASHMQNWLAAKAFHERSPSGIVIDTRLPEAFAGVHIPGSYSLWLAGLPAFGGWIAATCPDIYLILERPGDLEPAYKHLARIGIDSVRGGLAGGFEAWRNAGLPIESTPPISPADLQAQADLPVLDVRDVGEYAKKGHVGRAYHAFVGYLPDVVDIVGGAISKDQPFAVTCSVGHRASLAVSMLRQAGFRHPMNLLGGMTAWGKLGFDLKQGREGTDQEIDQSWMARDFPHAAELKS
ncbi:MAG: rhodanese-like domain-containing protein [Asticcacaulis sp.]